MDLETIVDKIKALEVQSQIQLDSQYKLVQQQQGFANKLTEFQLKYEYILGDLNKEINEDNLSLKQFLLLEIQNQLNLENFKQEFNVQVNEKLHSLKDEISSFQIELIDLKILKDQAEDLKEKQKDQFEKYIQLSGLLEGQQKYEENQVQIKKDFDKKCDLIIQKLNYQQKELQEKQDKKIMKEQFDQLNEIFVQKFDVNQRINKLEDEITQKANKEFIDLKFQELESFRNEMGENINQTVERIVKSKIEKFLIQFIKKEDVQNEFSKQENHIKDNLKSFQIFMEKKIQLQEETMDENLKQINQIGQSMIEKQKDQRLIFQEMEKKNMENQEKFKLVSQEVYKTMEKKSNRDEIVQFINKFQDLEQKIKDLSDIDASNKSIEKNIQQKILDFENKSKKLQQNLNEQIEKSKNLVDSFDKKLELIPDRLEMQKKYILIDKFQKDNENFRKELNDLNKKNQFYIDSTNTILKELKEFSESQKSVNQENSNYLSICVRKSQLEEFQKICQKKYGEENQTLIKNLESFFKNKFEFFANQLNQNEENLLNKANKFELELINQNCDTKFVVHESLVKLDGKLENKIEQIGTRMNQLLQKFKEFQNNIMSEFDFDFQGLQNKINNNQYEGKFKWILELNEKVLEISKMDDLIKKKSDHDEILKLFDCKANKSHLYQLQSIVELIQKQLTYTGILTNLICKNQKEKHINKAEKIPLKELLYKQSTHLLNWLSCGHYFLNIQNQYKQNNLNQMPEIFQNLEKQVQSLQAIFKNWQQMSKSNIVFTQEENQILDNFLQIINNNNQDYNQFQNFKEQSNRRNSQNINFGQNSKEMKREELQKSIELIGENDNNNGTQTNFGGLDNFSIFDINSNHKIPKVNQQVFFKKNRSNTQMNKKNSDQIKNSLNISQKIRYNQNYEINDAFNQKGNFFNENNQIIPLETKKEEKINNSNNFYFNKPFSISLSNTPRENSLQKQKQIFPLFTQKNFNKLKNKQTNF